MKFADIQKLYETGLITDEQRMRIVERFKLKEESSHFLVIITFIGAVLMASGIALLISAHWEEIPRGVKIAFSLALMLGAHGFGWWLREVHGQYRKTGEALHFLGSCLFLVNIALLGQIYNIASRTPDAFLLWWLGIAALPWLLRSKAQHVLLQEAFGIWFGFEVNERGSFIGCEFERQPLLYAVLGLIYLGAGYSLRTTAFGEFAAITERIGLALFLIFFYPLTWKDFFGGGGYREIRFWVFPALGAAGVLLSATGMRNLRALTRQWRWTWLAALLGMTILMGSAWFGFWETGSAGGSRYRYWGTSWCYLVATLALFVFCLLQIQIGIQERSRFLVNLGVAFVGLDIIATYCDLLGSMTRTGLMFVISGVFLVCFGVYLEKKRRALLKQMKMQPQERTAL